MSPILGIWASAQQGTFSGSFESIATATVGAGGAGLVTFSSIPQTYKHLQIRFIGRGLSGTTGFYNLLGNFNADGTSSYSRHWLTGDGASATASGNASYNEINIMYSIPQNSVTSNTFGAGIIDVLDYADTNKYKTVRALTGIDANGSGQVTLSSASWQKTSAVTELKLYATTGNFAQYSSFALYGIKGA